MKVKLLFFALFLVMCFGCAPRTKKVTPVAPLHPLPVVQPEKPQNNYGSLFNEDTAHFLFSDNRARHVGDIVVVNIVESITAKNKATTKSKKTSSLDFGVSSFLGQQKMHLVPLGALGLGASLGPRVPIGDTPLIAAKSNGDFKSDGETTRESEVTAKIAARVVRVLPNGVLQIEGARRIQVNGETQIIVVRGLVRSRDIGPDNSISSDYIANAQIEIYGQGVLADRQKPGWLTRLLDNLWPF
ncbi:MAG: flagellar basal body L-ring protein FlgH [Desulfonauticus sp.]|nr:flagellar basal body L-ring protein FlgH [Desulfonauticus sp.]